MAYFAAALVRAETGWTGTEVDLDDAEDLDGVLDLLREAAGEPGDGTALLFVEENDEWFAIVRLDGEADPRVFISDNRAAEHSDIAALLFEEAVEPVAGDDVEAAGEDDDDDDEETARPQGEPAGDFDVLEDLGTPAKVLLDLCGEEGKLPGDIISALCESAGCFDSLDALREA